MRFSNFKIFIVVSFSVILVTGLVHVFSKTVDLLKNHCFDRKPELKVFLKGDYWVFMNYVVADDSYHCYETITLATTADFTFLDNIIPAVQHWQGPVSLGVYAPGDDFYRAIQSIAYLRKCETPLIKKLITFHLIFDGDHIKLWQNTTSLLSTYDLYDKTVNCSFLPPYKAIKKEDTYRSNRTLYFPINVARNLAIESSLTYFILPIDIELYPSENFISKFLHMMNKNISLLEDRTVYVLPHFEVAEHVTVPETKVQLKGLFEKGKAFWFHEKLCKICHKIPNGDLWMDAPETDDLKVFSYEKRNGPWEPFFVITHRDPLFDERFTWEGQSNKMTQGYTLCLEDYNYAILNDAFLVHKPGMKKRKEQLVRFLDAVRKTNKFKKQKVKPEMKMVYGRLKNCML